MSGFRGGRIPPKFGQLPQSDLSPFIAEIESVTRRLARQLAREEDSRIKAVLREAFEAGMDFAEYLEDFGLGRAKGNYKAPSFDEWLADFIARNQEDRA